MSIGQKLNKPEAIIVDLDGTLTNCDHRVHLVDQETPEWNSFYNAMGEDELNAWCKRIIESFQREDVSIILITGRPSNYRDLTMEWLSRHNITYSNLYMRDHEDFRSDATIKREFYESKVKDVYQTIFVLDDRKSVVEMWREIGLTCLQPQWGEF